METRDPQEQRQSEPSPEETLRIRQARATFLTRWGRPPQPPDPLPAAYTEDAIERTLLALLEHHGGELVELDCTYYPCTAILLQPAESLLGAQDFVDMGYPHAQVRGSSLTPENDWFVVQVGVPAHSLTLRETLFQWRIERRLTERNEALVSELLQEAVEAEVLHAEPHG